MVITDQLLWAITHLLIICAQSLTEIILDCVIQNIYISNGMKLAMPLLWDNKAF